MRFHILHRKPFQDAVWTFASKEATTIGVYVNPNRAPRVRPSTYPGNMPHFCHDEHHVPFCNCTIKVLSEAWLTLGWSRYLEENTQFLYLGSCQAKNEAIPYEIQIYERNYTCYKITYDWTVGYILGYNSLLQSKEWIALSCIVGGMTRDTVLRI